MSLAHKEKLIDLVKSQPGLWLQSRKAPGLKQKIWDEIGDKLSISGYDARRQWEILRDQLRRETKRYKLVPNYQTKWAFYHRMRFMQERDAYTHTVGMTALSSADNRILNQNPNPIYQIKQERDCHANATTTTTDGQRSIIQVRQDLQGSFLSSPDMNSSAICSGEASTSAGVSSSSHVVSQNQVEYEGVIESTRRSCSDSLEDDDGDYYFALSIVPSLRYIRQTNKLRVRSKIMNIIAAALEEEESNMQSSGREDDGEAETEYEEKFNPTDIVRTALE